MIEGIKRLVRRCGAKYPGKAEIDVKAPHVAVVAF